MLNMLSQSNPKSAAPPSEDAILLPVGDLWRAHPLGGLVPPERVFLWVTTFACCTIVAGCASGGGGVRTVCPCLFTWATIQLLLLQHMLVRQHTHCPEMFQWEKNCHHFWFKKFALSLRPHTTDVSVFADGPQRNFDTSVVTSTHDKTQPRGTPLLKCTPMEERARAQAQGWDS